MFDFQEFDHSSISLEKEEWPVVIIGSSMVGMTLGVLLGYHGAALFLLRSIEIFRQLGLDALMKEESASNFDLDAGVVIVEQLVGGKVLARMQESDPEEVAKVSPSQRLWLTQNMFEPLLRKSAKQFGARQEFGQTVVHYEEVEDGVLVIVQDVGTKQCRKYKTSYLVATDGNRSATRRKEGIEWRGPGILGNSISINFKADLTPYLGTRAVHGTTYISNPKINAGFRLDSGGKGGFLIVTKAGEKISFAPDSVTEEEAQQYFYDASGLTVDDVSVKIDSISYWSIAAFNSDSFSNKRNRVFIAGDAAHVMPPTGGMGGNTGVQDVHNLARKLAYVLDGRASHSLLASYSTERQPAAGFTVQQAFSRLQKRVFHKEPDVPELTDIVCEIGYRYPKGAIVPSEVGGSTELWEDPYAPLVMPGSRLPHTWIVDKSSPDKQTSTLDLVKTNFVLIATDDRSPWIQAANDVSLKIDTLVLSAESSPFADPLEKVKNLFKLREDEALLVRPDGYIAWRAPREGGGHSAKLQAALDNVLKPCVTALPRE
ncbi:hypothetical protein H2201_009166 [Coniosporium apollinis]|uniref:FAD-binding domain-containing protein n=1 Tax=Coniosporium apollinis TaxID=61459 RepID=A0ABQ9NEK3_9PEZI|nr:hypothetical protein H2201_009166 [Coniosporium apollinis]